MCGNIRLDRILCLLAAWSCCLRAQAPDIMDIAPPVEAPHPVPWTYLIFAFVIGACAVAWYFLKHGSPRGEEVVFLDPHELALRRLDALAAETDVTLLYTELEAVLRAYLKHRFDLESPQATLREIGERMSARRSTTSAQFTALMGLLDTCELVRFGGFRPTDAVIRDTLASARAWIEETGLRLAAPSSGSLLFKGALPGVSDAAH